MARHPVRVLRCPPSSQWLVQKGTDYSTQQQDNQGRQCLCIHNLQFTKPDPN